MNLAYPDEQVHKCQTGSIRGVRNIFKLGLGLVLGIGLGLG